MNILIMIIILSKYLQVHNDLTIKSEEFVSLSFSEFMLKQPKM